MLYRRSFPRAIRFFKRNEEQHGHKFYLAELMLYVPFRNENELYPEDEEKCKKLYEEKREEIELVKAQLMPFLKSAEDARMIYEDAREGEDREDDEAEDEVGAALDPEKEQEMEDGENEGEEDHPEYLHIDPGQVEEEPKEDQAKKRVLKTIEIPSKHDQVERARRLDKMQKHVLSLGLKYAKAIRKSETAPTAPLVMVHGGAGSGKSSVINTLAPMMMDILQQPGDSPECPYVVLTSFTGSAAANIEGATLHHTFGLKFGNEYFSLPDKTREEKRCQFRNLKCVIIDEISMVSCDLLYCLDRRLREITGKEQRLMGGLAVFVFGDLFQLQPVRAKYVFEKPANQEHAIACELRNTWEMFIVVNLEENHRQGDDKSYADLLNRVRVGEFTDEDIEVLRTRVRSEDDEEIQKHNNDLHIYGTNKKVNERNKSKLEEKEGRLYTIKAANNSRMIRNFKPPVNNAGCVKNTPLQAVLKVKRGVEVILTWNVNVADGLSNGSRGVLLGVEMKRSDDEESVQGANHFHFQEPTNQTNQNNQTKKSKEQGDHFHLQESPNQAKKSKETVKRMIVKFHNKKHGKEKRASEPCHKFPEGTFIEPYTHQYHLGGSTATCQQFPLTMAAALTSHKIQGQTITKPNCLVIDMRDTFEPGMVYVMLSRVCSMQQLFILGELNPSKIKASPKVLVENARMEKVSLNRNPTPWNNKEVRGARVCSLNVRSLRKHMEDVKTDHFMLMSDVICLQETWLEEEESEQTRYQLEGYRGHFNCQGRGKGLVTYTRGEEWKAEADVKEPLLQISKVSSEKMDVINIYRSQGQLLQEAVGHLKSLVNMRKTTLILGDLNFCFKQSSNALTKYLAKEGFHQLVTTATHIEGRLLDQAHLRSVKVEVEVEVDTTAEYYSDHDLVTVLLPSGRDFHQLWTTMNSVH